MGGYVSGKSFRDDRIEFFRCRTRLKALDLRAVTADEEFREIPFYAVAVGIVRIILGDDLLNKAPAFFIQLISGKGCRLSQVLIEGDSLSAPYVHFGKQGECHAMVDAAEAFNAVIIGRFLFQELIRREAENDPGLCLYISDTRLPDHHTAA